MKNTADSLDSIWDKLLSRQPALIAEAFRSLAQEDQESVRIHLRRMAEEPGWQPEQRASAQAALRAIDKESIE
jgi:hypothetical protein